MKKTSQMNRKLASMARQLRHRRRENTTGNLFGAGLKGFGTAVLAAAGGWMLYSNLAIDHQMVLPDALPAERKDYSSRTVGRLSYYLSRGVTGRPLVLLHSINAAASAYEMRPLFMHYRNTRPVYALDLPGYGFSDRSPREYTPGLFTETILDFLDNQVGEPADVVALSLSGEFAARAAAIRPDRFYSLTLISPTGFSERESKRSSQSASQSGTSGLLHNVFAFPVWARAFYDLLATRKSIAYFLEKSFNNVPPQEMIDYAYLTSTLR